MFINIFKSNSLERIFFAPSLTLSSLLKSISIGMILLLYSFFNSSIVEINSSSDFLIHFKNSAIGYSHIDFLGKPHIRKLYITGTKKKNFLRVL